MSSDPTEPVEPAQTSVCAREATLLKEEREAIIQMMEDRSKLWNKEARDAVEVLVACIRARTP